ncbi:MAG: PAS domain-containing protein [Chloroflexota bacterium]
MRNWWLAQNLCLRALLIVLLTLSLLLPLWWQAGRWYEARLPADRRAQAAAQLTPYGNALTTVLNVRIDLPEGAWRLAAVSEASRAAAVQEALSLFLGIGLGILIGLLAGLVYLVIRRWVSLWFAVRQRTREGELADQVHAQMIAILQRITDGFVALDNNWNYTYVNARGGELLGRQPADLIGKNYWAEYPEAKGTPFALAYERALREQVPITLQDYYAPWERWFENRIYPSADGLSIFFTEITERKRAERALHESEARLRDIVSNTPDHILVQDRDLRYRFVANPQLGLTEADMLGKTDRDFLTKEDAAKLTAIKRKVLETGEAVRVEESILNLEGEPEFFEGTYRPRLDPAGRVEGLIGYFRNVTERKQAEEKLRAAHGLSQKVFHSSPLPAVLTRLPERTVVDANLAFATLFGYSRDEVIGRPVSELDLWADSAECQRVAHVLLEYGEVLDCEFVYKTKSGSTGHALFYAEVFDLGAEQYVLTKVLDITARKQAEETVQQRSKELAVLLEISQALSAALEMETVLQAIVESAISLIGVDSSVVYLLTEDELYLAATMPPLPPRLPEMFRRAPLGDHPHIHRAISTGLPVILPDTARAALSPAERTISEARGLRSILYLPLKIEKRSVGVLILGSVGKTWLFSETEVNLCRTLAGPAAVAIENAQMHERLQQHAAELEQRVAQRTAELAVAKERAEAADRVKSVFLATMSHELRTPLNSIIGFTGVMLQGLVGSLNPEQNKQLGMVQNSARHLLALINDVLDISKIEAGQLEVAREPFDLRAAVERVVEAVAPLAEKKGLTLATELGPEVGQIVSDRRRVEQVLLNLVNNAVKFTDAGQVQVGCHVAGDRLVTRVIDTGIGIKPEDMASLFEPFHQIETGLSRQHEGTGLGLSICKRLVELLGGEIGVESEPGAGSTFTFTLPVREA